MRALAMLAPTVLVAVLAGPGAAQPTPARAPFPAFPLVIGVARGPEGPVAPAEYLDAQVAQANRIYNPHGVSFRLADRREIDTRYARLESRADRHALGAELRPGVINVFVVGALRDVDETEELYRMGVHWRPQGRGVPRLGHLAHMVIITADAMPSTLAHELGHFFGNGHSDTPGNLMSYNRGTGPPFLDAAQVRRIHTFARRFLRTREIVPGT